MLTDHGEMHPSITESGDPPRFVVAQLGIPDFWELQLKTRIDLARLSDLLDDDVVAFSKPFPGLVLGQAEKLVLTDGADDVPNHRMPPPAALACGLVSLVQRG